MVEKKDLYKWCSYPVDKLEKNPDLKIPFRIVSDSKELGEVMARDFVEDIKLANLEGREYKAIVPCGPKEWYAPFARMVNEEGVSLKNMTVYHMDENLDWEGKLLHPDDPSNFRTYMDANFYGPIRPELSVPNENRHYLTPKTYLEISDEILHSEIDYTLGGVGQDGHLAFNMSRRDPYSTITVDDLLNSTARIQDNNTDTMIALANRSFGSAWQFLPPMSLTLGVKECLSAKKVRIYSATGSWKQTAVRVALFSEPTVEYPITLLSMHPDAKLTVDYKTACHPISEHPEWKFRGINA